MHPTPTLDDGAAAGTADVAALPVRGALTCRVHRARQAPDPGSPRRLFVLVHGLGMSHRYFERLQRTLIGHGDTLVLDLPGFGGTPTPDHQLDVEAYAAVIARVLDEEGVQDCVVIGHSMGAQFVTELAIGRPDLVSRLVLIGPVTDSARSSVGRHALMLAADTLVEPPVNNLMVGSAYARCGIRWYLKELPVMLGYRLDDRLPLVTCPVLVVRGTLDIISGHDWCERLTRTARHGRLVELPGRPHAAHRGGAVDIAAAILASLPDHGERFREPAQADAPRQEGRTPTHLTRTVHTYPQGPHPSGEVIEMRSVTVQDRQCRSYPDAHGSSAGRTEPDGGASPPVFVLIHGIGMSHRYFRRLGALLSADGEVHLIDLPGYGWTGRPAHATTNEGTAELIGTLLDEAGASSCVVVGHSMGAQSATELAIERPDLVSHLVLIGAAVDAERRTARQQALRLGVNSIFEKPLLSTVQFLDVLRCGPRWYVTQLGLAMSYPLEDRLPRVEQPVLVLRGSRDVVAGAAWSDRLARTARRGEAATIDGAPHAAHHSAAGAVATAIAGFLQRRRTG
ncbi:alpha/beta fold hydrolase [Arthrobacter sp. L77]|uniref:alpha/beta fold hydrolase n=1 Tax=Arthrobacter sp. L77 TaxID=1496689 RepID=UPI000690CD68|nr:alpha/beta hydrolase [Arthrobacter sp. L77]